MPKDMLEVTLSFLDTENGRVATRSYEVPSGINVTRIDLKDSTGEVVQFEVYEAVFNENGDIILELATMNTSPTFEKVLDCGFSPIDELEADGDQVDLNHGFEPEAHRSAIGGAEEVPFSEG